MKFVEEFKAFAMRGNVMDMAVGVVIGGAFGKIVTALVDNILMPTIGLFTGGLDLTNALTVRVRDVEIQFGAFTQAVIDFLIIAFCIFMMIKFVNKMSKKKEEEEPEPEAAPEPSAEEKLLTEIRDLLKEQK
ncbi:MAG: large-conductance mechanosensitive channel protein MscL [Bacteroidales bacterium]|nr:large-conductance mechanosensitive channel protein MscL [Bacteroidales bacterium]